MLRVIFVSSLSIEKKLNQFKNELSDLTAYPEEELSEIIREVGFECDLCGKCCTKQFNDHVFLLDCDTAVVKQIDPSALIPAPYFEFCDQHGEFYVSGYALRTNPDGTCVFLENNRCTIYDRRFSICRVYPYMLHREPDDNGVVDWRQISGLNEHGIYNTAIDGKECTRIAKETKEYEIMFLNQEIAFIECLLKYFKENGLKHVRRTYDMRMRDFEKGEGVTVNVYYNGSFEKNVVTKEEY